MAEVPGPIPFSEAMRIERTGEHTFGATLHEPWSVGPKPHGGLLMALLANAATTSASEVNPAASDPLAVSAQFLRPPDIGEVVLRTEVRKTGKTATVVRAAVEQDGRSCVEAVVTAGTLPDEPPAYADLPELPAEPVPGAIALAEQGEAGPHHVSKTCDVRLDPAGAGFARGEFTDPPRLRLWTRPPAGELPEVLFALLAGDIAMPVTFNLGRLGWSPTVQLTALPRARPVPGWLRIEVSARAVHGEWFDADAVVCDAAGTLVCQARQLALSAR